MPSKRKNTSPDVVQISKKKKAKTQAFVSFMVDTSQNEVGNSSDDSDDEGGAFPAFDLPNYDGAFNDGGEEQEEEEDNQCSNASGSSQTQDNGADDIIMISDKDTTQVKTRNKNGTSKSTSGETNSGIIFLSDPAQLPTPIVFTTPTVMKPIVIGQTVTSPSQVMVVSQTVGSKGLVPKVQPVVLSKPAQPYKPRPIVSRFTPVSQQSSMSRSASNMSTVRSAAPGRGAQNQSFNKHVAVPVTTILGANSGRTVANKVNLIPGQQRINQVQPVRQSGGLPAVNALASATASALASGMSATTIMQQVAQAAQRAAENLPHPRTTSTPNKQLPLNLLRGARGRQVPFSPILSKPIVNGTVRAGMVNQSTIRQINPAPAQRQVITDVDLNLLLAQSKKWKPYSDKMMTLTQKMPGNHKKSLGLRPNIPLNLKQMYGLLRMKFNTKQIYDMCLWDMEHADASLMEIAIINSFN